MSEPFRVSRPDFHSVQARSESRPSEVQAASNAAPGRQNASGQNYIEVAFKDRIEKLKRDIGMAIAMEFFMRPDEDDPQKAPEKFDM